MCHTVWYSGRPCFLFFWPGGFWFWPRSGFFAVFGPPLAGFFSAKMQGPAPAATRFARQKSFDFLPKLLQNSFDFLPKLLRNLLISSQNYSKFF